MKIKKYEMWIWVTMGVNFFVVIFDPLRGIFGMLALILVVAEGILEILLKNKNY
jgi:hypothetical protein